MSHGAVEASLAERVGNMEAVHLHTPRTRRRAQYVGNGPFHCQLGIAGLIGAGNVLREI